MRHAIKRTHQRNLENHHFKTSQRRSDNVWLRNYPTRQNTFRRKTDIDGRRIIPHFTQVGGRRICPHQTEDGRKTRPQILFPDGKRQKGNRQQTRGFSRVYCCYANYFETQNNFLMNIELNEEQVNFIEKKLQANGLDYAPLFGELLDHVCCMTEERMQAGEKFEEATKAIFDIFGKDELKKLQAQTIFFTHQKSRRMKNIFFGAAAAVLFFITIFFLKPHESETSPIATTTAPTLRINQKAFVHQENEDLLIPSIQPKTLLVKSHQAPNIKPIDKKYEVQSHYGKRYHPIFKKEKFHQGIDFRAPIGTPIIAPAGGEVLIAKSAAGWGKHILIQHDETYQTKYAHLSELKVDVGMKIKQGEVIGLVGSTGASTAPHLHYEVIKNGKRVNPVHYFEY